MAIQNAFCILLPLFLSSLFASSSTQLQDESSLPKFAFSWLDDKSKFQAGDIATINIKVLGNFDSNGNVSADKKAFDPVISVNKKIGNSSYISGVFADISGDPSTWRIQFTPLLLGVFNVIINEEAYKVLDSSLHFEVEPGQLYPSVCVASWMGLIHEFEAGTKATVLILPKDAFGNNISSATKELDLNIFSVSARLENGSAANSPNITHIGWNEFGYIIMDLIMVKSGNFLLHVEGGNQTLNGGQLPFKVNPGSLDVSNCLPQWDFETNVLQMFSKMEIHLHQQDQYGNLVPGLFEFDADVLEKDTNLSIPLADLQFEEVEPGIQLFSFSMIDPGNFLLTISDVRHNKSILNMPYAFTVYVGYCDSMKSIVNGSGLNASVVGESIEFSVYLYDTYQYPSPTELDRLRVLIVREVDSYYVWPSIYPKESNVSGGLHGGEIAQASAFTVAYTPTKSGIYKIHVSCGNIVLNGGHPFTKEVTAGEVNISLSGVSKFDSKVSKLIKNEITVQLVDSFYNPLLLQESRLTLEIQSVNKSGFSSWLFVDNNDGTYSCSYLTRDVGTYEMCVSVDSNHFQPCPFGVNAYSSEYFPKANDDTISVMEDESIAFDALGNDYFAGDNATIVENTKPTHGSLLRYGRLFRYTPYKDLSGHDSFLYTISDANGNLATASVTISILTTPPQFVSFPSGLQAIEDLISPRFGGFSGIEIRYSDQMENISVTICAEWGTVFLSPTLMQFGHSMWSGISVRKGNEETEDLFMEGRVEFINFALQSIQYLGNGNFSGVDTIQVSTRNTNGVNTMDVPVFVEPINDPPVIRVPKYIILKTIGVESLIYDREKDKFEFSVGDPDLPNFPGGESYFFVTLSLEVSDGFLKTSLPSELIGSTELKLKNSYQWQPLQTYVSISKHFTIKSTGVRFQATLKDCNSVMQQLLYEGGPHGAVLTVKLSDMGLYGCYFNCKDTVSIPLYAEATVNLIRRRPMSSQKAHTLGTLIAIEFTILFSLGLLLLFFTCKCAVHLVKRRRKRDDTTSKPSNFQSLRKGTSSTITSKKSTYYTGDDAQPHSFNQRIQV